jgi:hypothetical protein
MDKDISGKELATMDFSFITDWVDAKILKIDIELWQKVAIFHNPDVFKSLEKHAEHSNYWGKDEYACLTIHKRLVGNVTEQERLDKLMAKPCDMTKPTMHNKKSKLKKALKKELFIGDALAASIIKSCIDELGTCIFNYNIPTMVKRIIEYKKL